jgi:hypothetical protein
MITISALIPSSEDILNMSLTASEDILDLSLTAFSSLTIMDAPSATTKSATTIQKPFRFLDLPAELRCMVYENIDCGVTHHVLSRTEAGLPKCEWPVPTEIADVDSSITLVRPRAQLQILATCHLVRKEALHILQGKLPKFRQHTLRYRVDFSAACALSGPMTGLGYCIGAPKWLAKRGITFSFGTRVVVDDETAVKDFVALCSSYMVLQALQVIEMTITHKKGMLYGPEVVKTIDGLGELRKYTKVRLEVVYESSLPYAWLSRLRTAIWNGDHLGEHLRSAVSGVLRDNSQADGQSSVARGVFVRPLGKEEFANHLKTLQEY